VLSGGIMHALTGRHQVQKSLAMFSALVVEGV
jgi:hypothetical protein